jgi:FMN-dependent NADH-azoreductase
MFNFFKILYICLTTTLCLYGEKKMIILHIDSSIKNAEQSISRVLSAKMIQHLIKCHPEATVEYLDLVAEKIQAIDGSFFNMKPEDNKFLQQFLKADIIVMGVPMYNFSIPAQLKNWFDHIVIAGQTFKYENGKPQGLASDKKVFILSARNGDYSKELAPMDHQESYLHTLLSFIGICSPIIIRAEGLSGSDKKDQIIANAETAIQRINY